LKYFLIETIFKNVLKIKICIHQHFSKNYINKIPGLKKNLKNRIKCDIFLFDKYIYFRKEHEIKANKFSEWLNELDSKVNKCNIVPSNSVEETLNKLHSFADEHMDKQSLFGEIEDNLKNFNDNSTVRQSIVQFKVRFM